MTDTLDDRAESNRQHPRGVRRLAGWNRQDHRRVRPRDGLAHRGPFPRLQGVPRHPAVHRRGPGALGARFSSSEPFRPTTIRSVHADGDTVIVLWDGRGIANDGRPYENTYAWFMRMRDGKVVDGTAFFDSISFNDLWTRVEPR